MDGNHPPPPPVKKISLRAPKRTCWQKMDHVLTTYGFDSLGEFLSVLFHPRKRGEKDLRTRSHRHTVAAFLKGQSNITMADIIPLIFNHPHSHPKKRDADQHSAAFSPSKPLSEIRDYDDKFYRETIAPNVLHFLKIKEDMESAFELKHRSKSHMSPHLRDETKILLQLYKDEELHSFRSSRSMGHAAVNHFDQGYQRLEDGKLA
ncbi:hypothetical protein B0H14DRAFT_2574825, partial [Mycena olivaceomarginata]